MKAVEAKIIPIEKKAVDGSIFSRKVLMDYLNSDAYRYRMETKTMLGGITHINRDKERSPSDIIAVVDQMLLNRAITHYVSKLEIKGDWLVGEIRFLDENLMDSQTAECIRFIKGLILNGVMVPVSASVLADWAGDRAIRIIDIAGVDFTLDPGFERAGVINIKI